MRILVLNGSPRPKGNTKQMVDAILPPIRESPGT